MDKIDAPVVPAVVFSIVSAAARRRAGLVITG